MIRINIRFSITSGDWQHWLPAGKSEYYSYEFHNDWETLPNLNYENPNVRRYIIEVAEFWAKLGVDGFRCDAAWGVPHDFWKLFRRALKNNVYSYLRTSGDESFLIVLNFGEKQQHCQLFFPDHFLVQNLKTGLNLEDMLTSEQIRTQCTRPDQVAFNLNAESAYIYKIVN